MNEQDPSQDFRTEAERIREAAEALRREAQALKEAINRVYDPSLVSDGPSLHRMADYVQGRSTAARQEADRLQLVADGLRRRAYEAEESNEARRQRGEAEEPARAEGRQ